MKVSPFEKGGYKGDFPDSGTIIFNYHYMPSRVCSAIFYITSFPPIILFGAIFSYTEGLIPLFIKFYQITGKPSIPNKVMRLWIVSVSFLLRLP
jgi:hypothetical protein